MHPFPIGQFRRITKLTPFLKSWNVIIGDIVKVGYENDNIALKFNKTLNWATSKTKILRFNTEISVTEISEPVDITIKEYVEQFINKE